jgi:hypothetical protein
VIGVSFKSCEELHKLPRNRKNGSRKEVEEANEAGEAIEGANEAK